MNNALYEDFIVTSENQSATYEVIGMTIYLERFAKKLSLEDICRLLKKHNVNATVRDLDNLEVLPLDLKVSYNLVESVYRICEMSDDKVQEMRQFFKDDAEQNDKKAQ